AIVMTAAISTGHVTAIPIPRSQVDTHSAVIGAAASDASTNRPFTKAAFLSEYGDTTMKLAANTIATTTQDHNVATRRGRRRSAAQTQGVTAASPRTNAAPRTMMDNALNMFRETAASMCPSSVRLDAIHVKSRNRLPATSNSALPAVSQRSAVTLTSTWRDSIGRQAATTPMMGSTKSPEYLHANASPAPDAPRISQRRRGSLASRQVSARASIRKNSWA